MTMGQAEAGKNAVGIQIDGLRVNLALLVFNGSCFLLAH